MVDIGDGGYLSKAQTKPDLSFYVDVAPGEFADLEVVASAAIAWSQAVRAAAQALNPDDEIRVTLIAAEQGSSKWLAKVEKSPVNQAAVAVQKKWKSLPLIMRVGIGLVVVLPVTAIPTYEHWTGTDGFTERQKEELREIVNEARRAPGVEAPQREMYRTLQRDRKITGVGSGVPTSPTWVPALVPADQFPEGEGLFRLQEDLPPERILNPTLDVILVAPHLENVPRVWVFRQEGIPGKIRAIMKDKRFLRALERKAVKEQFRSNIPMRVRLEIKERFIDGEWRVVRKGRSVAEVIHPVIDPPEALAS